jgi:hypothetical protein
MAFPLHLDILLIAFSTTTKHSIRDPAEPYLGMFPATFQGPPGYDICNVSVPIRIWFLELFEPYQEMIPATFWPLTGYGFLQLFGPYLGIEQATFWHLSGYASRTFRVLPEYVAATLRAPSGYSTCNFLLPIRIWNLVLSQHYLGTVSTTFRPLIGYGPWNLSSPTLISYLQIFRPYLDMMSATVRPLTEYGSCNFSGPTWA